ncbi:peptidyl-prolyl cis-trans isomerase [Paenibacillus sp. TRM 82003]|nr:peptidyl-prolyl cis-trans isomerase [Paenibacillus sp. TRM 82003]
MSREKLLWGISGGLAILTVVLAVLLAYAYTSAPATNAEETPVEPPSTNGPSTPAPTGSAPPVAEAGGVKLSEEVFVEGLRESFGDEFVQQWLRRTVVRLEAQALGVDISRGEIDDELNRMQVGYESEAEFYRVMRDQLGMTRQELRDDALYRLMLEAIATVRIEVTDADVEAYIEANADLFAPEREMRYAQIVVDTQAQAEKVLEELGSGVDFALLAKDVSLDEGTAAAGGDSGWVSAADPFILEAFVERLGDMDVGDVSEPLRLTDERWAIVTLLGRRTIDPLDDSNVREELRRELALSKAPSLFDVEAKLLKKYNAVDFLEGD